MYVYNLQVPVQFTYRRSIWIHVHFLLCWQTKIKLGVMSIGAPACGSNAAVRSFVRVALTKGYEVLGLHDSFDGLLYGNVRVSREYTRISCNTKSYLLTLTPLFEDLVLGEFILVLVKPAVSFLLLFDCRVLLTLASLIISRHWFSGGFFFVNDETPFLSWYKWSIT